MRCSGNNREGRGGCGSCLLLDGKIATAEEWAAAGLSPGCSKLICGENCACEWKPVEIADNAPEGVEGWRDWDMAKTLAILGTIQEEHEHPKRKNTEKVPESPSPQPSPWEGEGERREKHQERLNLAAAAYATGEFEIVCITAGKGNGWEFGESELQASLGLWERVECFVDHTLERHSLRDLAGLIHSPAWSNEQKGITARLKAMGPAAPVLVELGKAMLEGSEPRPDVGFSADVLFTAKGKKVEKILRVFSVDLVFDPARGGQFLRALNQRAKENGMAEQVVDNGLEKRTATSAGAAGGAGETQLEKDAAAVRQLLDTQKQQAELAAEVEKARAVRVQMCDYLLTSGLAASKLPAAMAETVRKQFSGKVFEPAELTGAIEEARKLVSELTGGLVVSGPGRITDMVTSEAQLQAAVDDMLGAPREKGSEGIKVARLSGVRELYLGLTGDTELHGGYHPEHRRFATTTDFSGLVKNALNKIVANRWAELGRAGYDWWQRIAVTEHFGSLNTITGTLVGTVGSLPSVAEGAEYTELAVGDSPETASFTKYGGYIPLTLELIDRDETRKLAAYPRELANAGLRKISELVAAIFTTASALGPTLADTGTLFNATAVTTKGGHKNLLTTALAAAEWEVVSAAVYNQPMLVKQDTGLYGTGPKMALNPRYCLVPRALQLTARKIFEPGWENASNIHSENLAQDSQAVVTVPEWTDATDWAAVVDPVLAPAIFVGERFGLKPEIFIAGNELDPAVFSNDEHRLKVRHFLAVWVNDFRPLHKSNV
jgi:hypothetical protein